MKPVESPSNPDGRGQIKTSETEGTSEARGIAVKSEAMDVDEELPGDLPPAISTAVVSEHSSCDESSLLESHRRGRRHKARSEAEMSLDIPPSITEAACNSSEDEQSIGSVLTEGSTGTGGKLLYNENLDDEDEAYVYKHSECLD